MDEYLQRDDISLPDVKLALIAAGLQHIDTQGTPHPITISVLPTTISHHDYSATKSLIPAMNLLLDRASKDYHFIVDHLSEIAQHDSFCNGLLEIYKAVHDSEKKITLGLFRHDFMYDISTASNAGQSNAGTLKLVEFNLIAASLVSLADGVGRYHKALLNSLQLEVLPGSEQETLRGVQGMAEGIVNAHKLYQQHHKPVRKCIVILVDEVIHSFNYFDQQHLLNCLEDFGIATMRCTVADVIKYGHVSEGRYYLKDREVAVFYFRVLYDPAHFDSEEVWEVRKRMELSFAVTVPCIRHQIINMKLFQMVMCDKAVVQRYISDTETVNRLIETFGTVLSLDIGVEGDKNAQLGIDNPDKYVLKPQREGGLNNYWGEEMVAQLQQLEKDPSRSGFILMRILTPPLIRNRFIHRGEEITPLTDTISEFGIYSTFCTFENEVQLNTAVGSLVRIKPAIEKECSIRYEIAGMGSPYFV